MDNIFTSILPVILGKELPPAENYHEADLFFLDRSDQGLKGQTYILVKGVWTEMPDLTPRLHAIWIKDGEVMIDEFDDDIKGREKLGMFVEALTKISGRHKLIKIIRGTEFNI